MYVSSEIKIGLVVIYNLFYINIRVFSCAVFMSPQYSDELKVVCHFVISFKCKL